MQQIQLQDKQQQLTLKLKAYKNRFVNVIDYNIAVSREHAFLVAEAFEQSEVLGWMAEMCIESLDDDELLLALSKRKKAPQISSAPDLHLGR